MGLLVDFSFVKLVPVSPAFKMILKPKYVKIHSLTYIFTEHAEHTHTHKHTHLMGP